MASARQTSRKTRAARCDLITRHQRNHLLTASEGVFLPSPYLSPGHSPLSGGARHLSRRRVAVGCLGSVREMGRQRSECRRLRQLRSDAESGDQEGLYVRQALPPSWFRDSLTTALARGSIYFAKLSFQYRRTPPQLLIAATQRSSIRFI